MTEMTPSVRSHVRAARTNQQVGIYLGYRPNQDLRVQGIGRLIGLIVAGMTEVGRPPVIAIARWSVPELLEVLADVGLDESDVEILSSNGMPALLTIREFISRIRNAPRRGPRAGSLRSKIRKEIVNLFAQVLSQTNILTFLVTAVLCAPLIVLLGLAQLALRVFALPIKLLRSLDRILSQPRNGSDIRSRVIRLAAKVVKVIRGGAGNKLLSHLIYDKVLALVKHRLIRKVNAARHVRAWLVPAIFWSEVEEIGARVVVTVPDLVYCEFPSRFLGSHWEELDEVVRRVTSDVAAVVTYSSYVKERHLGTYLGLDPSRSHFVPHAPIDMSTDLAPQGQALSVHELRGQAEEVLREYQLTLRPGGYLADFDLTAARFIIFPSQYRPHKNMLNLVKAVEKLIRSDFVDIKLALTANPTGANELIDHVRSHRLEHDVIFFHNVPPEVLAALNTLAVCSVNPTLFEGGFPFTFSEAFSVGTPSIMSTIPVVTNEIVDPELRNQMLFDPYDINAIAERVGWAIDNPSLLYDLETPLYKLMMQRSWSDVAREYLAILDGTV